jgi:hypothetical protein
MAIQKWEYAEMEVNIGGPLFGEKAEVTIFKSNDKHETTKGKAGALLAKMGEAGWELVSTSARIGSTALSSQHKMNYVFKRPLNE